MANISNSDDSSNCLTVGNQSQFYLPSTMVQYSSFGSFLSEQPTVQSKEELYMQQLLGTQLTMSNINMSMFTVSISAKTLYQTWNIPKTWEGIFNSEIGRYEISRAFQKLQTIANQGYTIYPLENEIFRAFELCPRNKLKVVILAQDPYPSFDEIVNLPMACGLSFSGRKGGKKPKSLDTVFTEIRRTFPGIHLDHFDLTSWAQQGVLLLNTCLTVNHGDPESHIKERIWNYFIEYVIKTICEEQPGIIFCLWGAKAKAYNSGTTKIITSKSIVLEAGHPSGMNTSASKFAENNHFAYIWHIINQQNEQIQKKNVELQEQGKELLPYKEQINWTLV